MSSIKCFYLLALSPAASSLAAVVTLGGLSSSQRDMASSVVVALFKFKRRSIDAMRVSNGALGIYRVRSDSSRLRSQPGLSGSWFGEREKKERRGGWHGRGHSYRVGSDITEKRRIKSCTVQHLGDGSIQIM
ncbi:hypothetical protein CFAM422_010721 [Trichoderma lentiforme]|uniref:Secreted protein n=1 Tax=Trichoderma lentiforme TaxID=1567552 RepID=A0A9P4X7J4_9HYPO|nr:hypothetical protein CFAM422_010721 [Trichoderma lentiforme]